MAVEKGDKVKLHLIGRLPNGRVFASTEGREPLELTAGAQEILPVLDKELIGMKGGEEKIVKALPHKAFGRRKPELLVSLSKAKLKGKDMEVGQRIVAQTRPGRAIPGTIVQIGPKRVTLDLNHPLAGKKLLFRIKVLETLGN